MEKIFYPKSVMVVGVSPEEHNLGRNIVENLDRFGFEGPVYPVGREGGSLNGRKIAPDIEAVEAECDLVVFIIPARYIPDAMEKCGRKGIRFAVIESAGFAEYGEERRELEARLCAVAKKWNIRFVGPNCISVMNMQNGLILPFVPFNPGGIRQGCVSFVAQSGGVLVDSVRLFGLENLGFSKLASIGNKLNLNENNFIEFLTADGDTRVIGLYLEGIADGRRLMNAAYGTEKPIIVLKANTNDASRKIAQFHTASLVGDDATADAAFRQAGLIRVTNMQELMEHFKIFSMPLLKGPRLALICRSGGLGVMVADATYRSGLTLAEFSDDFYAAVRKNVRAGVIRMTNPLDLGDVFDLNAHMEIIEKALKEKDVDGVVFGHAYVSNTEVAPSEKLIEAAGELSFRYDKPVVFTIVPRKQDWFAFKEVTDFPVFSEAEYAIRALGNSYRHFKNLKVHAGREKKIPLFARPEEIDNAVSATLLGPAEAYKLLQSAGLPVADWRVVKTADEARRTAAAMGYPVALKTADPAILHKTDAQGVVLNIASLTELEQAMHHMETDAFLVQKMAHPGREVIIGGKVDNEFGPIILFGLGGIFVEVLKDTVLRVAPVDEDEARLMIDEIRGRRLLGAFRGRPPADEEALVHCLVSVSRMLYEHPEINNLDINPMIVGNEGEGCLIVDAKIEIVG